MTAVRASVRLRGPGAWLLLAATCLAPGPGVAQTAALVGADGSLDLNRYYTAGESDRILRELHARYPGLTELHVIGESFLGAPLLLMEVTNEATGPASDKPALYVDGGIHAAELTGSAVALHLLHRLLTSYGSDPRITRLLDGSAFYIRPKFNPDGSDLVLIQDQYLRSSVHPVDEDHDGLADEDPPQDLDGDGWITSMRIPDPQGGWYAHPDDPRVLVRIQDDEPPPTGARRYRVEREGIDDDGDGALNEDGVGGIDMNRNFPRNWERVHLQPGAGAFPLSEPETYATVRFIDAHRNIVGIVHGHTSGGFVYRLPSASAPSRFPTDDLALIEHLGAEYTRSTGRPVVPSATHPTEHRYGTLISWGYWDQGVVGWVPEYSPGPESWVPDADGDGEISALEEMRFNEEELGGRYFSPWTPIDHPGLGTVEVGGWHTKLWGQNPPEEFLEDETEPQLHWHLWLLEQAPRLALDPPRVTPLAGGRYRVEAKVRNEGVLPTSLTGRGAVGRRVRGAAPGAGAILEAPAEEEGRLVDAVVAPPTLTLELRDAVLPGGASRVAVEHLAGTGGFIPSIEAREQTVTWVVVADGPEPRVRVVARSDKAGTVHSPWLPLGGR